MKPTDFTKPASIRALEQAASSLARSVEQIGQEIAHLNDQLARSNEDRDQCITDLNDVRRALDAAQQAVEA